MSERFARSCAGKKRYNSARRATEAAKAAQIIYAQEMNAYACEFSCTMRESGVVSTGQAQTLLEVAPVTPSNHSTAYGYCQCGCERKTTIAPQSVTRDGYIKGEPRRYVCGHQPVRSGFVQSPEHVAKRTPIRLLSDDVRPKKCNGCKEIKSADSFGVRTSHPRKDGSRILYLRSYCKACERKKRLVLYNRDKKYASVKYREYVLSWRYGLSQTVFDDLMRLQKGCCAICGRLPKPRKHLSIDHDHKTGRVRGLLCDSCNCAIGLLGDSESVANRAATYISGNFPLMYEDIFIPTKIVRLPVERKRGPLPQAAKKFHVGSTHPWEGRIARLEEGQKEGELHGV